MGQGSSSQSYHEMAPRVRADTQGCVLGTAGPQSMRDMEIDKIIIQ